MVSGDFVRMPSPRYGPPQMPPNATTFATKGQNVGTQHVEGRQTGGQQGDHLQAIITMFKGQADDGILTVKAREERETRNRECGNQPGNGSNRHVFRASPPIRRISCTSLCVAWCSA